MIPNNKEKEIYSEEEVRVGTWIDGKPLYRKVITVSDITLNGLKSIAHGIADIDYITDVKGTFSSGTPLNHNRPDSSPNGYGFNMDRTNLHIRTGMERTISKGYIIVEYTKISDIVTLYQRGDINMDGVINQTDYDLLNTYLSTGSGLSEEQKILADVNGDGRIRTTDLDALQNLINNA